MRATLPALVATTALAGCWVSVIDHDQEAAAARAVEFAQAAFVRGDVESAHRSLSLADRKKLSLEKLREIVAGMHPRARPTAVTATEFEPIRGQPAMYVFLRGENGEERFHYRVLMAGTASGGYHVAGFWRGSGAYPPSGPRWALGGGGAGPAADAPARVARLPADFADVHGRIRIVGWKDFDDAVKAIASVTGTKPAALGPGTCARSPVPRSEARAFVLEGDVVEQILEGSHVPFREGGLYLFRCERGYQTGRRKDVLAIVKARDPRVVIRKLGTGSPRSGPGPGDVVAVLDALGREVRFDVTEIGVDYVAARLEEEPRDARALAEKVVAAAPALRELMSVAGIAQELRRDRRLYLWWPEPELAAEPVVREGRTRVR